MVNKLASTFFPILFVIGSSSYSSVKADFREVTPNQTAPNSTELAKPIDRSDPGELTISSFNVRNFGTTERSLKDIYTIVNLVDESDIVVFQEAGLGLFKTWPLSEDNQKIWEASLNALVTFFGPGWEVITAGSPTGEMGRETTILAHRINTNDFLLSVEWKEYIDLGPRRDMAVFLVKMQGGDKSHMLQLGSVHLKPEDPYRGTEMKRVADWLVEQESIPTVVLGDFNWGYGNGSQEKAYMGEKYVKKLHDDERLFQVFAALSYIGKGTKKQFRTNMSFRADGKMYDQFLLSPVLAEKLADGGKLLEDFGFVAFDVKNDRWNYLVKRDSKRMQVSLKEFKEMVNLDWKKYASNHADIKNTLLSMARERSTHRISDHRPIWLQLRLFD